MDVKKLLVLATVCAAVMGAGVNIAASAESGLTIPEDFSVQLALDSVTDYATDGSSFAFADGTDIYIYSDAATSGGNYTNGSLEVFAHSSAVTAVEYSGSSLYFADAAKTYVYSDGTAESANFSFTQYSDSDTITSTSGKYLYYIMDNYLSIIDKTNNTLNTTPDAAYSALKQIDGTVYVLKDSTLCTVTGNTVSELALYYDDYDAIAEISTNATAEALKAATDIQIATVAQNACLIRIDEEEIDGTSFVTEGITFAEGGETAQVLYNPSGGNAALIAIGSKAYLTLKTSITVESFTLSAPSMMGAYLLDGAGVYSLPYESGACLLASLDAGEKVTVTGAAESSALACNYYKVEYTESGSTVTGYVAASLLTPYTFASDDADDATIADEEQTGNIVTTVVLVMIIVCLVLVAIGYIAYVATAGNKGARKK